MGIWGKALNAIQLLSYDKYQKGKDGGEGRRNKIQGNFMSCLTLDQPNEKSTLMRTEVYAYFRGSFKEGREQ